MTTKAGERLLDAEIWYHRVDPETIAAIEAEAVAAALARVRERMEFELIQQVGAVVTKKRARRILAIIEEEAGRP